MRAVLLPLVLLAACAHVPNPCERTVALRQEFGFALPKLAVQHQGEAHALDIDVRYHYADALPVAQYPDFVPMAKEVTEYLTHYEPAGDFWEVLNQRLVDRLMQEHPELTDLTIKLQVDPTSRLPYHRFSRVARSREGCLPVGR
jgi:hypothetical protein